MKNQTTSLEFSHFPVMLSEIIDISSPSKGGFFVDCTFGGGGYTKEILKFPNTRVIGLDRDATVLSKAKKLKKRFKKRFNFYQLRFSQIDKILNNDQVDAIIFDLGISSIQLKDFKRGFSYRSKENLDMSMGLSNISAQEVVNNLSEPQLKLIIKILGEEKEASIIAKNIVRARAEKKITKVNQLVQIIERSKKKIFSSKINPCTKTFQALRIFVNKEISELINGIVNATKYLKPGGKILIVSFHSIEDKIVKYFFSNFSKNRSRPSRYLPDHNTDNSALFEYYERKAIKPKRDEIEKNNPSRSAKLRFAIRSEDKFVFPKNFFQKFNNYLEIEGMNV
ncbi:MAG: 16S rRNA (cytosine(1402)-N(4))-methyltransferase RsmH [Pseudomonadota bacterium]|nr:16S rRNA (cytosine(1402)-N(4))-methyltransferase RsmH [Pseudomonadota bacterium]